jgi:hypothetical protein
LELEPLQKIHRARKKGKREKKREILWEKKELEEYAS